MARDKSELDSEADEARPTTAASPLGRGPGETG